MPHLRTHNGIRILAAIWAVLWMAVAAPCAVAGDLGGDHADRTGGTHATHVASHTAPADNTDTAGQLLCLHDCNQVAVGQGYQELPSAPLAGLAEAPTALAAPSLFLTPSVLVRTTGPPPYRAATYLLNQSFLI